MILFHVSLNLNCFEVNTSVVLDAQTNSATFTGWPLQSDTTHKVICNQLQNQVFIPTVFFGIFNYTGSAQTFTNDLTTEIVFECKDTATLCQDAFKQNSATFSFYFPESNIYMQDVIALFTVYRFNRMDCYTFPIVQYDQTIYSLKVSAQTTQKTCKTQISTITTGNIQFIISGYPDFVITKEIDIASIPPSIISGSPIGVQKYLIEQFNIKCSDLSDLEDQCKAMIDYFQKSTQNFVTLSIHVPALIPNNETGVYNRNHYYLLEIDVNSVTSQFVEQFDCYNDQQVSFYNTTIMLQTPSNVSQINCLQNISNFIGNVTSESVEIEVQQNVDFRLGEAVSFKYEIQFSSQSQCNLQITQQWFSCADEMDGLEQCKEKMKKVKEFLTPSAFVIRTFKQGDQILQKIQQPITTVFWTMSDIQVDITPTYVCMNYTIQTFTESAMMPAQVTLLRGEPKYVVDNREQQIQVIGLILFPNQVNQYCFNFTMDQQQEDLFDELSLNVQEITMVIDVNNEQFIVNDFKIMSLDGQVNYALIVTFIIIIAMIVWFVLMLKYKL